MKEFDVIDRRRFLGGTAAVISGAAVGGVSETSCGFGSGGVLLRSWADDVIPIYRRMQELTKTRFDACFASAKARIRYWFAQPICERADWCRDQTPAFHVYPAHVYASAVLTSMKDVEQFVAEQAEDMASGAGCDIEQAVRDGKTVCFTMGGPHLHASVDVTVVAKGREFPSREFPMTIGDLRFSLYHSPYRFSTTREAKQLLEKTVAGQWPGIWDLFRGNG